MEADVNELNLKLTDEEIIAIDKAWEDGGPFYDRTIADAAVAKAAWKIQELLYKEAGQWELYSGGVYPDQFVKGILEAQGIQKP